MAPGFFCTFCETVLFVSLIKDWGPEMVSVPPKIYFSNVVRVAISPDGKILASGSNDTTIKLWNLDTGKLLRTLKDVRFMRIDVHVAIAVFGVSCFYRHFLVPAMHAADGVRVYGEGQVLMHAALAPEDAG